MRSFGPYIALHLRYEKDMLAFSGCTYGLSQTESEELAMIRQGLRIYLFITHCLACFFTTVDITSCSIELCFFILIEKTQPTGR